MNKVIILNKGYNIEGGVEKFVRDTCMYNKSDEIIVQTIARDAKKQVTITENTKIIEHGLFFEKYSVRFSLSFLISAFYTLNRADKIILHSPDPLSFLVVFLRGLFDKNIFTKTYIYVHNQIHKGKPFSGIVSKLNGYLLSKAHTVMFSSPNLCTSVRRITNIRRAKVVPLGVNLKNIEKRRAEKRDCEKLRIVYVGRLEQVKGVDILIDAISLIPLANDKLKLKIVGDGSMKKTLQSFAANRGLGCVEFSGRVPDEVRDATMKESDVLVLPSIHVGEGFGYVCLEAMSQGCCCITTELGTGTSFVNLDGHTGIVVGSNDARQLCEAILSLYENPDLVRRYQNNSIERVKIFEIEKNIDLFWAVIHE